MSTATTCPANADNGTKTSVKRLLERSMSSAPNGKPLTEQEGMGIICYSVLWSLLLLLAVPFACLVSGEGFAVFANFGRLLTSPSKLVTDYFCIGSLGAAFLNAALCGLSCNLVMLLAKAKPSATLLAGYFLVIAHCFYGLNLINMWPPFLGVFVFSRVFRERFGNILHLAMFATSLGPFISDFLFRYTLGDRFVFGKPELTVAGVVIALVFGLLAGFLVPALLPGTTKMHRGHNLFKAGLAIGLFGMFAYALFYKTIGIPSPDAVLYDNPLYTDCGESYIWFIDVFFGAVFALSLLIGFFWNGRSFRGYSKIWHCDGWQDDFPARFGLPLTLINIGFYGLCVVGYLNVVYLLTNGVGYSGPSVGVTIAAITFSAGGQTPKNVWPIVLGYVILSGTTWAVCTLAGLPLTWTLTTQGYINGLAFATGLCPFTGRYGRRIGVVAGILHAILCTSTAAMHGGFVLYNGGLTSGLTALLLLPVLDFYHVKVRGSDGEK